MKKKNNLFIKSKKISKININLIMLKIFEYDFFYFFNSNFYSEYT